MKVLPYLKRVDWRITENRTISDALLLDAREYMKRVVDHIYKGNDIRADSFMDISEKQDEIRRLDSKRTDAHNKMLKSFAPFLRLLKEQADFNAADYRLESRTQIADFVALIAFELIDMVPETRVEGSIRDELAEKIHAGEVTYKQISTLIEKEVYGNNYSVL